MELTEKLLRKVKFRGFFQSKWKPENFRNLIEVDNSIVYMYTCTCVTTYILNNIEPET